MEELQARHRKEQRELQNKITQKKKNATKKTRKGVNDECDVLQRDLEERQRAEVEAFGDYQVTDAVKSLEINGNDADDIPNQKSETQPTKPLKLDVSTRGDEDESLLITQPKGKKPNRQKARLARRAADQEAQAATAADEAANLPDLREQEMTAMKAQRDKLGLEETIIRPDGHCLYSAVAHSMSLDEIKKSGSYPLPYQNVRFAAADFIAKHPNDFIAFLEEPLETYVKKIRDTAEWGGQLELQAIARAYQVNINVVQADGRIENIESDEAKKEKKPREVWLAYYRHSFGLGEHYNALQRVEKT